MASTYSNLKIQLMTTGENSGTWGNVTNVNLGTAIEEAIVGSADVTFSSANVTLTLTDSNSSQVARNLRLNLIGTTGGARDLIVPAIEKVYLVNNGCADAITVKNSTGIGIAVPAGRTMWVYNTGANVIDAVTHLTSLSLTTVLPVTSGGTGTNTSTGSGNVVLSTSPTLVTPILGTPSSGTLTNCTGLPLTTGVTGTLPNGNTTASSSNGASTIVARDASGNFTANTITASLTGTASNATVLQTARTIATSGGATGTATSFNGSANITIPITGLNVSTADSGILAVARGGTGVNTSTGTGSTVLSVSPALTGTPTATTATNGTNTTQIATTAFVSSAVTIATGSLGTMSTQNANAVAITGGTINGATVGASTAAAGTFTTATATTIALASGWTATVSGGKLIFQVSGVTKASLDSSGNFIVTGNVTAYGTP
jgi:hypothetical protein